MLIIYNMWQVQSFAVQNLKPYPPFFQSLTLTFSCTLSVLCSCVFNTCVLLVNAQNSMKGKKY